MPDILIDDEHLAHVVRVQVDNGREGLLYAKSSELKGLLVAAPDTSTLANAIPMAITRLFLARDLPSKVFPVGELGADGSGTYVAIPDTLIRSALAAA